MSVNIRSFWNEIEFNSIARWWLAVVLLLLPFQRKLVGMFVYISYVDEITIAIFFLCTMRKLYKLKDAFDQTLFILLLPITLLFMSGLMSGLINGKSFVITILGTIDYIKNFLVIFIYAAFFKDPDDFKKIFRYLLIIAVFLGVVSFFQEFWALFSRYILGKDIMDITYILAKNSMPVNSWRYGIYRAPSFVGNANSIAFYCLLILTIYLCSSKKINHAILISILSGVLFSGSRSGYVALITVVVLLIVKDMKLRFFFVISTLIICLSITFWDFKMPKTYNSHQVTELNNHLVNDEMASDNEREGFFREYTKKKAMEIWKDRPMLGIGPGMFGGKISVITNSHIYEEYNLEVARNYIKKWSGIDQYWPQVLAEIGIIGFLNFAVFFLIMSMIFFMESQRASLYELKGLFAGLMIVLTIIFIFTLGSGLNFAPLVFTFSAFAGMALGCREEFKKKC